MAWCGPVILSAICMLLSSNLSLIESQNTCTDITRFTNLVLRKYLEGSEFHTLANKTLLGCVKECQQRNRCVSFNFGVNSGDCVLNEGSSADLSLNFMDNPEGVYSEVIGWPWDLAGACANHTCPENTGCRKGLNGQYECVVETCVDPPHVDNAQMTSSSRFIEIGSVVAYVCESSYVPVGDMTCLPNGTWAGEFRCMPLQSCSDVKACNSSYGDGEYWIYVRQDGFSPLKIYCHDMDNEPKEFLTLKESTYSQLPYQKSAESCNAWWHSQHCGKTVFSKVRFNHWDLQLFRSDSTFATTDCALTSLGWIGDCRNCPHDTVPGSFHIDTRGTGVTLANDISWNRHDYHSGSDPVVSRSSGGKIITVECIGNCDYCEPTGSAVSDYGILVVLDSSPDHDISNATVPQCSN